MPPITEKEHKRAIRAIVSTAVQSYATGFADRHVGERENPEGVINLKVNNVFIASLGGDIAYYSALCRSLDSSLGNMFRAYGYQYRKAFI